MLDKLAPRERQVVDLLYKRGASTVSDVCDNLPVTLSASAVRAMLTRLESKGYVAREHSDRGYVYIPAVSDTTAKQSALQQVVTTFFGGSPAGAASALLGMSGKLDDKELDALEALIAKARKEQSQ